jgi:dTDP-4-dehydrorhamnose reductase
MLGSMIVDVFSRDPGLAVTATVRDAALERLLGPAYPNVRWTRFAFERNNPQFPAAFEGQRWIVNCIGITKPLIRDDNAAEIERAIWINSILPHEVARHALDSAATVLQIATDCVYSGAKGAYTESDPHDALDVYGKTKSLGETYLPATHHLRCSIIGPEPKDFKFLIEWFRRQPHQSQLNGFVNHRWNGVTTLHFARLCLGIIRAGMELPRLHHVVPHGTLTKAEMLHDFARAYSRPDIVIRDIEAKSIIDRTLATTDQPLNEQLWKAAGYQRPPAVSEMIAELGAYDYRAAREQSVTA